MFIDQTMIKEPSDINSSNKRLEENEQTNQNQHLNKEPAR